MIDENEKCPKCTTGDWVYYETHDDQGDPLPDGDDGQHCMQCELKAARTEVERLRAFDRMVAKWAKEIVNKCSDIVTVIEGLEAPEIPVVIKQDTNC